MMYNETMSMRIQRTAHRLATDYNVAKKYFNFRRGVRKLRDYMIDWYAEIIASNWECRPRGKPPWHKGRWKTRGGRDQDRWRKRHSTVKTMRERRNLRYRNIEDYCRANGIEFRRFTPDGWCSESSTWSDTKALKQTMTEHSTSELEIT